MAEGGQIKAGCHRSSLAHRRSSARKPDLLAWGGSRDAAHGELTHVGRGSQRLALAQIGPHPYDVLAWCGSRGAPYGELPGRLPTPCHEPVEH
jgi:hypothetical protein